VRYQVLTAASVKITVVQGVESCRSIPKFQRCVFPSLAHSWLWWRSRSLRNVGLLLRGYKVQWDSRDRAQGSSCLRPRSDWGFRGLYLYLYFWGSERRHHFKVSPSARHVTCRNTDIFNKYSVLLTDIFDCLNDLFINVFLFLRPQSLGLVCASYPCSCVYFYRTSLCYLFSSHICNWGAGLAQAV
jgi:hypothetical protein